MSGATATGPLRDGQGSRQRADATRVGFVDIHAHLLPGMDDGPSDRARAIALCARMAADGVTHAVATPHQFGMYEDRDRGARIRESVEQLRGDLERAGVALCLFAGADVRIDDRLFEGLESGEVVTLADAGRFVLLELPHEIWFDPEPICAGLNRLGVTGILTHPERNAVIARSPELVYRWLESGARLQVTAASLLGEFGSRAQTVAWQLLDAELVSVVASDAHDVHRRPPRMSAAAARIAARLGQAASRRMCVENPWRLVSGTGVDPARGNGAGREAGA